MIINRPINTPLREELSPDILWRSEDRGLIHAWEFGRRQSLRHPELKEAARKKELPPLPFQGGYDKQLEAKFQYGSLHYYCMLQGLLESDLNVDINQEYPLVCSRTGMGVVYTIDSSKFLSAGIKKFELTKYAASFSADISKKRARLTNEKIASPNSFSI